MTRSVNQIISFVGNACLTDVVRMPLNESMVQNPELVFGLVGPIGVDLNHVVESLKEALEAVGYTPHVIHVTELMQEVLPELVTDNSSYANRYNSLIKNADAVRRKADQHAALAGMAISDIRRRRTKLVPTKEGVPVEPALGNAFIVRQFKRAEEIQLMRQVYGRKFIQVSIYLDKDDRESLLIKKIKSYNSQTVSDAVARKHAIDLIEKDFKESQDEYGQRVSDVFHLGDIFVKGDGSEVASETIRRFINAFFGDNGVSPTKIEYGMYAAAGAALRSLDLSRQVGAAIFSPAGEIITMGCNEVPKAFGGTYWSDDEKGKIHRDFEEGHDGNHSQKLKVLHDLVERLGAVGAFSEEIQNIKDNSAKVDHLLKIDSIAESKVMDLIEFGRMIHAEMSAISDAARNGRPTKGAHLYCTTFPCHICAKHIVSAGIDRVIFLEPYPKSHTSDFHADSITLSDTNGRDKVLFEPFIGISPRRYRDIFEKGKRKDSRGKAIPWAEGGPVPRVEDRSSAYIENEEPAISLTLGKLVASTVEARSA